MLTNIEFLTVHPEITLTEHHRAKAVIEKLHEPFFEMNDDTVSLEELRANAPRQFFVPDPNKPTVAPPPIHEPIGPPPGPRPAPEMRPPAPPMISPPPPGR